MHIVDLEIGDPEAATVFKTLDQCKAVVPIVTRGYAKSLQCMRELYYAKLKHQSAKVHPVVIEDGWEHEACGQWLKVTLGEVKITIHDTTNEDTLKEVAMNIAKVILIAHNYSLHVLGICDGHI